MAYWGRKTSYMGGLICLGGHVTLFLFTKDIMQTIKIPIQKHFNLNVGKLEVLVWGTRVVAFTWLVSGSSTPMSQPAVTVLWLPGSSSTAVVVPGAELTPAPPPAPSLRPVVPPPPSGVRASRLRRASWSPPFPGVPVRAPRPRPWPYCTSPPTARRLGRVGRFLLGSQRVRP